ncbi:SIMPL domain-containing protein [Pararoseomonas indoligenes]|uniref:SIMPL domain-containing protein n=1 Tax=Roseomonas indoligenes TaxID=2820811 RepID=A0A940N1E5_9PROT|nr:SIMPL domain-containing protein [Pararoseomonas indoligenes]MBP0494266.1 SIMPL domain-containing protein [Pararoseomonas indoligenes]
MSAPFIRGWAMLALLAAPPALAQAPGPQDRPAQVPATQMSANPAEVPGLVAVGAEARRRLPATVSDAVVTIEVHGRDLRGTAAALAGKSGTLLAFLRAQGAERLRTESTGFEPELQEVRNQPDRIKGYAGRATVSFRTVPDRLPALLSGSLENGATGLLQSGSLPREEEVEAARQELAAEATRTALARARAVAAAAEARVAGVQRIEMDPPGAVLPYGAEAAAPMMRAQVPVPPMASAAGEAEVVVRVTAVLRLAPGAAQ